MTVAATEPQVAVPARAASAPPGRRLTDKMLLEELLTPEEAAAVLAERATNAAEQRAERTAQAAAAAIRHAEPDARTRAAARAHSYSEGSRYQGKPPVQAATIGLPSSRSGHQRQIQQFHLAPPPSGEH